MRRATGAKTPKTNAYLQLALDVAAAAEDRKGHDIAVLDVESLADFADHFLFVTGANRRQVQAIADAIEAVGRERDLRVRVEGYASGWWVVVDLGTTVAHVFQTEARRFYDLDHLWADATRISLPERVKPAAAGNDSSGVTIE